MQSEFRVYGREGEPCYPLRPSDREDARRGPRHVVLPELPDLTESAANPTTL